MANWLTLLNQLEIPDGAVAGPNASDKAFLRGKLLQSPAANRPLFFVGQPLEVLKTLRPLQPDKAEPDLMVPQVGVCAVFSKPPKVDQLSLVCALWVCCWVLGLAVS